MDKFGIIGNPVAGSMSPRLFAAAYGGRWPYELIEGADFARSWSRFLREYKGINITAPFKEDAFRAADRIAPAARRIGAVNLAVQTPEGVVAYNTDYEGVRMALREADAIPAGGTALVVGCGGAGRAAAAAVRDAGLELLLLNRTRARAETLAEVFGGTVTDSLAGGIRAADVIIYTVPQAMEGLAELQEADFRAAEGRQGKVVLEANYKTPAFAGPLRERLERAGGRYISGRRWLLHQAVSGYELFTGEAPDPDRIIQAL